MIILWYNTKKKREDYKMEDTIVAISTALQKGAISIIRLSGKEAINIVESIFKGQNLTKVPSHTIHYGFIMEKNTKIDEVLVSIFKSPKSYTKEDVVEINCHGSIATTNKILELPLTKGCRLAEPGEFTKRAFLNGRIDLTQAEAVSDLISSKTDKSREMFLNQLTGELSSQIKTLRQELLNLLANIAVNIDYPEYEDATIITNSLPKEKLGAIIKSLNKLLKTAKNGKIIKDGINIALVGRPNVGKSSLLNKLLQEEKAIVTDIAGTTRDIVEGSSTINGITFNFIDTAGIRKTTDIVEKLGVDKSKELINKSDYIICVLNGSEKLTKEDQEILAFLKNKNHLIFINKNDQKIKLDLPNHNVVYGNTIFEDGINKLKEKLIEEFNLNHLESEDPTYLSNARQISLVKRSLQSLENALNNTSLDIPVDLLELDIKQAYDLLGEITGETYQDELIDELFKNFCLGK